MPINSEHPQYKAERRRWKRCRDVIFGGGDAVKEAGVEYLPSLSEQTPEEYKAYVTRADFFAAAARTLDGFVGMMFRKDPVLSGKDDQKILKKRVCKDGKTLFEFMRSTSRETLGMGRLGVLIDAPARGKGKAFFAEYPAESILNWKMYEKDGKYEPLWVVLKETAEEPGEDEFESKSVAQIRLLRLIQSKLGSQQIYIQQIYRRVSDTENTWKIVKTIAPRIRGRLLDYIPFRFISLSGSNTGNVERSPMIDIVDVNLSHFRSSADLEHGRHFTGLPTPYAAGFPTSTKLKIGSMVAWVSSDPNAQVGFLEFTGQGLTALENALKEKKRNMAILGARLLEEQVTKGAEATETHRLRKSGENNIVALNAKALSGAITELITWISEWRTDIPPTEVELNTDYIHSKLGSDEILALTKALLDETLSPESFVYNMKQGETIPDNIETSDEVSRIKNMLKERKLELKLVSQQSSGAAAAANE